MKQAQATLLALRAMLEVSALLGLLLAKVVNGINFLWPAQAHVRTVVQATSKIVRRADVFSVHLVNLQTRSLDLVRIAVLVMPVLHGLLTVKLHALQARIRTLDWDIAKTVKQASRALQRPRNAATMQLSAIVMRALSERMRADPNHRAPCALRCTTVPIQQTQQ